MWGMFHPDIFLLLKTRSPPLCCWMWTLLKELWITAYSVMMSRNKSLGLSGKESNKQVDTLQTQWTPLCARVLYITALHCFTEVFLCRYAQIECGLYFKLKALKQSELGVMICFHIFHFYSQKSTFLCLTLKLTGIFFVNTAHTLTKCSFPAETMIYPVTCSELRGGYFNPPPCTLRACHFFIYFIKYTQITIEKLCF